MSGVVLQLSNDYLQQDVYRHLTDSLAARGVRQFVFMASRSQSVTDRCPPDEPLVRYAAPNILRLHHKVLFRRKSELIFATVASTYDLSPVRLVHAHFMFSDGQVARMLHERCKIPFVVSVRPHTDIDSFMRLRPDLMPWGCENLLRAHAVICLSPGSRDLLLAKIPSDVRRNVRFKIHVVPHGLAPEWYEAPAEPLQSDTLRILSVGDMSRNKNIRGVVKAIDRLVSSGWRIKLTLVGGRGGTRRPFPHRPWIEWIPHVANRLALRAIVRENHLFLMPSFSETFGVAYVEALSQGLPAIHSRGQGISGLFEDGITTEAVDPHDPDDIANAIVHVTRRRLEVFHRCIAATQGYRWSVAAERIHEIYRSAGVLDTGGAA